MSLSTRGQQAVSGDPKRDADIVKYARAKVDPEKQFPDVLLMAAMICGMAGVVAKIRILSFVAFIFVCSSLAKADKDYDMKLLIQSFMFVFFGLGSNYFLPMFARNKLIKDVGDAAGRIQALRQAAGQ